MNTIKTIMLMTVLTLLVVLIGDLAGGRTGMFIALAIAAAMNLVSYWFSDKIVLAMYRARPVDESSAPQLYRTVRNLATRGSLPMPRVYVIPEQTPNAFATGRNPQNAVVAVTEGLMRMLSEEELEGVLAHELAHVGNRDMLIGTIAATMAGAVMLMARIGMYAGMFSGGRDRGGGFGMLFLLILAPIAALLIQMAVSRSREYQADASGAKLTGNPQGLARALARLEQTNRRIPMQSAEPTTSHMFIVNPLTAQGVMSLFSTHPPIQKRIERLEAMAARR